MFAHFFDYIFIAQKDYITDFKKYGNKNVYWLPLAASENYFSDVKKEKIFEIGFIGQTGKGFEKRARILKRLSSKYKMNDFSRYYTPREAANIYRSSKIVINVSRKGDLNARVFEVLASGTFLLTEKIGNGLLDIFKDNVHLSTFSSEEELFEKIEYYLKNETEREKIAENGKELVHKQHRYSNRMEFLVEHVLKLKEKSAYIRNIPEREVLLYYMKSQSSIGLIENAIYNFWQAVKLKKNILKGLYYILKALRIRIGFIRFRCYKNVGWEHLHDYYSKTGWDFLPW